MARRGLNETTAKFKYEIFQDVTRGPNRVSFERDKGLNFFRRQHKTYRNTVLRITHLSSGLYFQTDNPHAAESLAEGLLRTMGEYRAG